MLVIRVLASFQRSVCSKGKCSGSELFNKPTGIWQERSRAMCTTAHQYANTGLSDGAKDSSEAFAGHAGLFRGRYGAPDDTWALSVRREQRNIQERVNPRDGTCRAFSPPDPLWGRADQPGSGHARSSHLGFQPNSRTPVTKNHAGNCSQRRLDATMWRN